MALSFDVSFTQAVQDLQEFHARLAGLGGQMDKLEREGTKLGRSYSKMFERVDREATRTANALMRIGMSQEDARKKAEEMRTAILRQTQSIANGYMQAATRAEALRGNIGELGQVLSNTKSEQNYANAYLRISTIQDELNAKSQVLRAQIEALGTAQGREVQHLQQVLRARQQEITYLDQQATRTAQLRAEKEFLESAAGREQARLQAEVRERRRAAQAIDEQTAAQLRLQQARARDQASYAQQGLAEEWSRDQDARRRELAALRRDIEERSRLMQQAREAQSGYSRQRNDDEWRRAEQQRRAELDALRRDIEERTRLQERMNRAQENQRMIIRQLVNAERELALTGQQLAWGYDRLSGSSARLAAQQAAAREAVDGANRAMIQGERNLMAYTGANAQAAQAAERLRRVEESSARGRRSEMAELRRDIEQRSRAAQEGVEALERYTGANARAAQAARRLAQEEASAGQRRQRDMAELRRAIEQRAEQERTYQANARRSVDATRTLSESEARNRNERQNAVRGAQAYNQAMERNADAMRMAGQAGDMYARQLQRINANLLTAPTDRLNAQFATLARNGREATSSMQAMTSQQARLQAAEERSNKLLELRNRLTLDQARASQMRSGQEATLTRELQRQIAVQERRNRLMGMTTAELLGFSSANARLGRDMRATAQAAAMFRASLSGLGTSIGIYTGGTIAAATATYMLARALRSGLSAGMEFTETMSKAEAIMFTGVESFSAAGKSMEGVSMMVRALGASTLFTATEVSGGLVDLGMAGLSASDAMTALAPALNLAAIGGIEMSRAADIATNVMTTFNMAASDLGEVVDIMATAVTNSNTNIEQLANAISYVGPAAQAAGFELRDTVAAIELLSSSGIKASRAGTGLRRFMLNIQNPTAKGAAVLERFNISIVDAEGATRSMTDILGQFNRALHDDFITPAQRSAAIMDLVGVRAQSAVARMIGSFDGFGVLRRQLEEVEGAAEAMRKTMEENLTGDWRKLKSAFQDVQLEIFDDMQHHLRRIASHWTLTFAEMSQVVEGESFTGIELLISRLERAGGAVVGLGAAFLSLKASRFASVSLMAGAEGAKAFADRLGVLNARTATTSTALSSLTLQFRSLGGSIAAHTANIVYAQGAYSRLTAIAYSLGTGMTYVARAASLVMASLGWVGVIWGAYTAVSSLFGKSTEEMVDRHNDRIEESKKRYEELQEAIEATQEARMRAALQKRRQEAVTELTAARTAETKITVALEYVTDAASQQALEDQLYRIRQRASDLERQADDTQTALGQLGINQLQYQQMTRQLESSAMLLGDNRLRAEELRAEQARLNRSGRESGRVTAQMGDELRRLAQGADILRSAMALMSGRIEDATHKFVRFSDMARQALRDQRAALAEDYAFSNMGEAEQMNNLLLRRQEIMDRLTQMDVSTDAGADQAERLQERLLDIGENIFELEMAKNEALREGMGLNQEIERARANEERTNRHILADLQAIRAERAQQEGLMLEGSPQYDWEKHNDLKREELRLTNELNQANAQANRSTGANTRNRDAERRLEALRREEEQMRSNLDSLLDKLYPIQAAQKEYADSVELLQTMHAKMAESALEAAKALGLTGEQMRALREDVFDLDDAMQRLDESFRSQQDPADVYDFMDPAVESTERAVSVMEEAAKSAARNMQSAFADFLFDPFDQGLKGMLQGFIDIIRRMIAEAVAADLMGRLFGEVGGGSGSGWLPQLANAGLSAWAGSSGGGAPMPGGFTSEIPGFSGGGFTGWGARAGGVDGKGGFPAILHPRETVVDHTKPSSGMPQQNITNRFIVQGRPDLRTQKQMAVKAASAQRRASARFSA